MQLHMFKSKLHQIKITEANLMYEGSITIDTDLLEAANLLPYEKVQVVNINNGARLETYIIEGEAGSGICCLNGAAARHAQVGDNCIIMSYATMSVEEAKVHKPTIVILDTNNAVKDILHETQHGLTYEL